MLCVFYCCITNYHKCKGFKQYLLIISHLVCLLIPGTSELDHLLRVSPGRNHGVGQDYDSHPRFGTCFQTHLLLTEFISLQLYDWGLRVPSGYHTRITSRYSGLLPVFWHGLPCTSHTRAVCFLPGQHIALLPYLILNDQLTARTAEVRSFYYLRSSQWISISITGGITHQVHQLCPQFKGKWL